MHVRHTLSVLAAVRGVDLDELAARTDENASRAFGLATR
jgi:Tat protein secretion system quality control protein TatD with DNase activity